MENKKGQLRTKRFQIFTSFQCFVYLFSVLLSVDPTYSMNQDERAIRRTSAAVTTSDKHPVAENEEEKDSNIFSEHGMIISNVAESVVDANDKQMVLKLEKKMFISLLGLIPEVGSALAKYAEDALLPDQTFANISNMLSMNFTNLEEEIKKVVIYNELTNRMLEYQTSVWSKLQSYKHAFERLASNSSRVRNEAIESLKRWCSGKEYVLKLEEKLGWFQNQVSDKPDSNCFRLPNATKYMMMNQAVESNVKINYDQLNRQSEATKLLVQEFEFKRPLLVGSLTMISSEKAKLVLNKIAAEMERDGCAEPKEPKNVIYTHTNSTSDQTVNEKHFEQKVGVLAKRECQLGKALTNINAIIDQTISGIPTSTCILDVVVGAYNRRYKPLHEVIKMFTRDLLALETYVALCEPFNISTNPNDKAAQEENLKFFHDEIFSVVSHLAKWVDKFTMGQWPDGVQIAMVAAIREVQRENIGAEYSSLFGKFSEKIKIAADEINGPNIAHQVHVWKKKWRTSGFFNPSTHKNVYHVVGNLSNFIISEYDINGKRINVMVSRSDTTNAEIKLKTVLNWFENTSNEILNFIRDKVNAGDVERSSYDWRVLQQQLLSIDAFVNGGLRHHYSNILLIFDAYRTPIAASQPPSMSRAGTGIVVSKRENDEKHAEPLLKGNYSGNEESVGWKHSIKVANSIMLTRSYLLEYTYELVLFV